MRNWPYALPLLEAAGSPVRGRVAVAPLPTVDGAPGAGALGGWHLGVSARLPPARRAAAEALVAHLTSPEAALTLALAYGRNPARRALYADPRLRGRCPVHRRARAAARAGASAPGDAVLRAAHRRAAGRVLRGGRRAPLAGRGAPARAGAGRSPHGGAVTAELSERRQALLLVAPAAAAARPGGALPAARGGLALAPAHPAGLRRGPLRRARQLRLPRSATPASGPRSATPPTSPRWPSRSSSSSRCRSPSRCSGAAPLLRAAVLVPWAIPTVVAARLWAWLFDPDYGLVNRLCRGRR